MNPSLMFALLTILLMCEFQERLFDVYAKPKVKVCCYSIGTALSLRLSVSSMYAVCELSMPMD